MAGTFNRVIFLGRLVRDPETRTFASGSKVVNFSIAVDGSHKKDPQTGQWETEPCFIDCKAFDAVQGRKLATQIEESLSKGSAVLFEGHLVTEKWVDSQSGANRSKNVAVVDHLTFVEKREPRDDMPSSDLPPAASRPSRPEEDIPF